MAKTFLFELVSPEKILFSAEVESVILPGSEGYLTVMANHAPLITGIIPGIVRIAKSSDLNWAGEGNGAAFVVFDGFADITPQKCSLLATSIVPLEEFSPEDLERRIAQVQEAFNNAETDEQRNQLEDLLHQLTTVRGVYTAA
ncbi:MAG: ATP synthase epsilon chain [Candidatus Tokpelaia hoelldobleri]|uniref:ATP synthase epsilon chain n=1 Tax=Candidatus Tokpelaia hoelldobleri TaxID=1902579 RepID=A0A1U9JT71_9HYPH|nr:MAG: ATP synthase epsilon chain [Candidatus Tokpelaia hoelldoblerii]